MTVRHNSRRVSDPEALAALLPDELRTFRASTDPEGFRSHLAAVADWLNDQIPGAAEDLTMPVMKAAGLSATDWYRSRLSGQPNAL